MQKKLVNLEKGTEELRVFLETTSPQTWILSSRVAPDSLQRKHQQSHTIQLQPVEKEGIWSKIRNLTSSLADEITSFGKPNPSFQQPPPPPVERQQPLPVVVGKPTPNYQQYPVVISPIRQFNNNNNSIMNNNNPLPIQQQPTYQPQQQYPMQPFPSISPYEYNYQTQNQFNNRRRTKNVNGSYSAEPQHNPPHSYYYYYPPPPSTNERPITNRKVTFRDPKDNCYYMPGREEQIQSNYYSGGGSSGVADEQDVCNFINGYRTSIHPSQYHRNNYSNYSNYSNYNNYSPIQ